MKENVLERLTVVLNALNSVYVRGKENLANMTGSIQVLEEVLSMLSEAEITEPKQKDQET